MADISTELAAIQNAVYGEEVRGAIIDALEAMNESADSAEMWATGGTGGTASATNNAKFYSEKLGFVLLYNSFNIVDFLFSASNATSNGATYTWTDKKCVVTGTNTTGTSVNNIIPFKSALPDALEAGKTYDVVYETDNQNISLGFVFYDANDAPTYVYKTSSGTVTIPDGTKKMSLRLLIGADKNPAGNVTNIGIITAKPNNTLYERQFRPLTEEEIENLGSLLDVPENKYLTVGTAKFLELDPNFPFALTANVSWTVFVYGYGGALKTFELVRETGEKFGGRTTSASPNDIIWTDLSYTADNLDSLIYGEKSKDVNFSPALTFWRISAAGYDSSNRAEPSDIPINSYCYTGGTRLSGFETNDSDYYWVICLANLFSTGVREYIVIDTTGKDVILGWSASSGANVVWEHHKSRQPLKVLTIGSSFGQDCMTYVPYIIDTLTEKLDLTVGIAYASGGTISQYNGWFDTTDTVSYYKHTQGTTAWTSASSKTLKAILTDEKWDVILINQAADSLWNLSSYADLNEYLDKMAVYAAVQNGKSAKFGLAVPQVALRNPTYSTYENVISCVEQVLETSPIDFITPCVTAIENARGTSLDAIGSYASVSPDGKGHLCADGPSSSPSMPGHLQEGLPCLIAGYTTALAILKLVGIEYAGILGNQLRPTAEYLAGKNIPGQNGTSVGVTDENCLLGQKCAIAAIKKPFEITTIEG